MPFSSNTFDDVLVDHIYRLGPKTVLDVGAGAGKNGKFVKHINKDILLEAIEPTQNYIEEYQLGSFYDTVYQKDILSFTKENSSKKYDLIIIGDVLEHLFKTEVIDYLDYFLYRAKWIIAIWPTHLDQDDVNSNSFESHKSNFYLKDLANNFDIVYYVSNFGWENPGDRPPCVFHYCVLKGFLASKQKFIYNFKNWK